MKIVITKILQITKTIVVLGATIFLGGCIGMNSKFDCNVSSGGKCAPMSSIHKMADHGEFNENYHHKAFESGVAKLNKQQGYPLESFAGNPLRSSESVQQIWIGPYEDATGNYHEPAYVYAVVKKGRWLGETGKTFED
jgi:hypothetical protein